MVEEKRLRKMQRLTRANNEVVTELQETIEGASTSREKAARRFIIQAFTGKMPSLIPFAMANQSILNIASYLLKYTKSKSTATLYQYVFGVHRFCQWMGKTPDQIIREILFKKKTIDDYYIAVIDAFVGDLQAENLAPGTINNHVKGVKTLFRVNNLTLVLPFRLPKYTKYSDRAPTPEELSRVMQVANVKEKVATSMLALSGMRIDTLVKLTYGHIR